MRIHNTAAFSSLRPQLTSRNFPHLFNRAGSPRFAAFLQVIIRNIFGYLVKELKIALQHIRLVTLRLLSFTTVVLVPGIGMAMRVNAV